MCCAVLVVFRGGAGAEQRGTLMMLVDSSLGDDEDCSDSSTDSCTVVICMTWERTPLAVLHSTHRHPPP